MVDLTGLYFLDISASILFDFVIYLNLGMGTKMDCLSIYNTAKNSYKQFIERKEKRVSDQIGGQREIAAIT